MKKSTKRELIKFFFGELIEFKIVRNPLIALMNHLKQNIDNIIPFGVSHGYYFQVRIDAKQFEALPDTVKNTLRESCLPTSEHPYCSPKEIAEAKRWAEENYWTPIDGYIFEYVAKGYRLSYNEVYGYEGVEDHDTLYFLNINDLPKRVWKNRNTYERREDYMFRWK